jgi:hypothetical protein
LNRRRSGSTCSRSSILVAIALLITLGALALVMGSGTAHFGAASAARLLASNPTSSTQSTQRVLATYNHLPLMFEPNQGQTDPRVRFLARGSGYGLYLTGNEAVLALQPSALEASAANSEHPATRTSVVRMKLIGAASSSDPVGDVQLPGRSNYFIGNDPAKWHRDIPQFARVRYRDVYPGIDLVYYGNQGRLEYDFEVAPGSDPKQVALKFQGPHSLSIDAGGDLVLAAGGSDVRLQAPRVYQKFGAEERSVAGRFELRGEEKDEVGFQLGAYDRNRALIIDPVLTYGRYLGGIGIESCSAITGLAFTPGCPAIAVDAVSNVYVAGSTTSADFPGTSLGFQKTLAAGATANAFVAKLNVAGSLLLATYLGGNGIDYTAGVAVDAGFDVIVAGTTSSTNFPTNGSNAAFQPTPASARKHVFVSNLDPTGAKLLYSTYLSGNAADIASGLAVDPGGTAYVTGTTASSNFPTTTGALQTTPKATNQSFFSRVDPNSTGTQSLMYSTYIGGGNPGTGTTVGGGIAVDTNSNAYITGGTNFTDMPVLSAYQGTLKGGVDAFVIKINPSGVTGTQLLYATYFGGSGDDVGYGIAVDLTTNAYITGSTTSPAADFVIPTGTTPFQAANAGGTDAFLAKFGTLCTTTSCTTTDVPLNYFTFLGGSGTDIGTAVAIDVNQGARLTGWTNSPNFHLAGTPLQSTFAGGTSDAFVARIDTVSTASYSSYFGGTGADIGTSIAADQQGASYVSGETSSPGGFLGHAFLNSLDGPSDAFASKVGPILSLTFSPAATATPSPVGVGGQVSFKYTITNSGEFTNGVTFTDHLQASGETFGTATPSQGSCTGASGTPPTVSCSIGALNTAATATVTVVVTPVAPTLPGNSVILGNSGEAGVGGSTLTTTVASVKVNDFSLAVAPASATVPAGVPATFNATVTPSANDGFPGSVTLACGSGLPNGATCLPGNNNPILNLNSGPQSAQLIINTTARVTTTTDLRRGGGPSVPLYAAWVPVSGLALLGVGLGGKRSRPRRALTGLLLAGFFGLALFQAACGSSKHTTTTTGTPAGTYPVTINATSGTNATRSTVVTLVVE